MSTDEHETISDLIGGCRRKTAEYKTITSDICIIQDFFLWKQNNSYCCWILQFIFNPFATGDAYMRQLFHCLQWYTGSERVKMSFKSHIIQNIQIRYNKPIDRLRHFSIIQNMKLNPRYKKLIVASWFFFKRVHQTLYRYIVSLELYSEYSERYILLYK